MIQFQDYISLNNDFSFKAKIISKKIFWIDKINHLKKKG